MKKLIVSDSEQRLSIDSYCSKTLREFEQTPVTDLLKWDVIVFAFSSMTRKKANLISVSAGTKKVDVFVLCKDIDECMEHFKQICNMNNSKSKIQFVSELFENGDGVMIIPD